jgi:uncharacterized membrane protein
MDNEKQVQPGAGEAQSLRDRIFESKVLWVIFLISFIWTLSIFIAPFLIPPGTVADLEGSANRVDFQEIWDTMPPYPEAVYYLGDAQCHQISSRTIYLNDNEMPVCSRDVSIFLFITLGLFAGMFVKRNYYISAGVLSVFPKRFRDYINRTIGATWFTLILVALFVLPVGLDGGMQFLTDYESTNLVRILTGIPTGFIAGLLIAILVKSVKATREYALEDVPTQEIPVDSD